MENLLDGERKIEDIESKIMEQLEEFPLKVDPYLASRRVSRSPLDLFLKELYAAKSD